MKARHKRCGRAAWSDTPMRARRIARIRAAYYAMKVVAWTVGQQRCRLAAVGPDPALTTVRVVGVLGETMRSINDLSKREAEAIAKV